MTNSVTLRHTKSLRKFSRSQSLHFNSFSSSQGRWISPSESLRDSRSKTRTATVQHFDLSVPVASTLLRVAFNGSSWDVMLRDHYDTVAAAIRSACAEGLGLPEERVTVVSLTVGSLIVVLKIDRNVSQAMPEAVVISTVLNNVDFSNVTELYRQTTGDLTGGSFRSILAFSLSALTDVLSSCDEGCWFGIQIAVGVTGFFILFAGGTVWLVGETSCCCCCRRRRRGCHRSRSRRSQTDVAVSHPAKTRRSTFDAVRHDPFCEVPCRYGETHGIPPTLRRRYAPFDDADDDGIRPETPFCKRNDDDFSFIFEEPRTIWSTAAALPFDPSLNRAAVRSLQPACGWNSANSSMSSLDFGDSAREGKQSSAASSGTVFESSDDGSAISNAKDCNWALEERERSHSVSESSWRSSESAIENLCQPARATRAPAADSRLSSTVSNPDSSLMSSGTSMPVGERSASPLSAGSSRRHPSTVAADSEFSFDHHESSSSSSSSSSS